MMPSVDSVRIEGLSELQRHLRDAHQDLAKDLRKHLLRAAQPVRKLAASKALTIGNVGPRWSRMRVGVTTGIVYIVPASRRRTNFARKRPNLGVLLVERAMEPALDEQRGQILADTDGWLDGFIAEHHL